MYTKLIAILFPQNSSAVNENDDNVAGKVEFRWGPEVANGTASDKVTTCRNSVQGKVLLADDQGRL